MISSTRRLFVQIDERKRVGAAVGGQFAVPFLDSVLLYQQGIEGSGHYAVVVGLTVTLDLLGFGLTLGLGDGDLGFGLGFFYLILGLQVNSRTMKPSRFMDSSRRARTSFSNLARLAISSSEV